MPRTLSEVWTESGVAWEPPGETQPAHYWHERESPKSLMLARLRAAKREARRQAYRTLQRETWRCPHCQGRLAHRAKNRRTSVQQEFSQLADVWQRETAHQSNMTKRVMHPAYQRIIGMGPAVIPFILERFRQGRLEHWFWALSAITGENPITEDMAGNIEKMAKAWVQGGTVNGYLSDSIQHLKPYSPT
jgi:hypothetical protein